MPAWELVRVDAFEERALRIEYMESAIEFEFKRVMSSEACSSEPSSD